MTQHTSAAVAAAPISQRFLDDMLALLDYGEFSAMVHALTGHLHALRSDAASWPLVVAALRRHRLHQRLLEDPYLAHSFNRPRGYPGDAGLIDLIYDRAPPPGTPDHAARLFAVTTGSVASEAVRLRCAHGRALLGQALGAGRRVCVLACGHFREGDHLIGQAVAGLTLIDQDAQSLAVVRRTHPGARIEQANVFSWLRRAAIAGQQFDLVYTLGLTDYLDDRALTLLHRLMRRVVAPGGQAVIANFRRDLVCAGWMEAVMDWHLIYRDADELAGYGRAAGFEPHTRLDRSGHIVWSKLQAT